MKKIRQLLKKLIGRYLNADVSLLKDSIYVGSTYHGYHIPSRFLDSNSVCYCVGAGIDISFDIELVKRFSAKVFIFDPMPYALSHFKGLVNKTRENKQLTIGAGAVNYTYDISEGELSTVKFIPMGLWNEKKLVKFYYPTKGTYAGHSITNLQSTNEYIEAQVDTLSNVMADLKHQRIDLLKLEIEGAEYTVIDNLVQERIDIKILLVEFDEFHHKKGKTLATLRRIKKASDKICRSGYTLAHSISCYKRTFIRNDVFALLPRS